MAKAKPKQRSEGSPPREGDIYAIAMDQGGWAFGHILLIQRVPPKHGPFLRVFRTLTAEPTWDASIAASGERFRTFFPVSYAQRAGVAKRVATMEVPAADQEWPLFKTYWNKPQSDERIWFRLRVDTPLNDKLGATIPSDLLDAPFPRVVNLTALSRLVATDWNHRTEVRPQDLA